MTLPWFDSVTLFLEKWAHGLFCTSRKVHGNRTLSAGTPSGHRLSCGSASLAEPPKGSRQSGKSRHLCLFDTLGNGLQRLFVAWEGDTQAAGFKKFPQSFREGSNVLCWLWASLYHLTDVFQWWNTISLHFFILPDPRRNSSPILGALASLGYHFSEAALCIWKNTRYRLTQAWIQIFALCSTTHCLTSGKLINYSEA